MNMKFSTVKEPLLQTAYVEDSIVEGKRLLSDFSWTELYMS